MEGGRGAERRPIRPTLTTPLYRTLCSKPYRKEGEDSPTMRPEGSAYSLKGTTVLILRTKGKGVYYLEGGKGSEAGPYFVLRR